MAETKSLMGYAVFFANSDEFSIEEHTEASAEDLSASAWFPTFTEAKRWSIEAVKHTTDSYRSLLRSVRALKKADVA